METLFESVGHVQDAHDLDDRTTVQMLCEFIESKNLSDDLLNILDLKLNPPEDA